jgi:hypothetical protein
VHLRREQFCTKHAPHSVAQSSQRPARAFGILFTKIDPNGAYFSFLVNWFIDCLLSLECNYIRTGNLSVNSVFRRSSHDSWPLCVH